MENGYDETTFVYSAPEVLRMTVFVEVHVVAEPEDEEADSDDGADHNYPSGVFDAGSGFFSALFGLSGRLLSFHNLIKVY